LPLPIYRKLLAISPSYDLVTRILRKWAERVAERAWGYQFRPHLISGESRAQVEGELDFRNPKFCCAFAHGGIYTISGMHDIPIIDLNNSQILSRRVVYAISCYTARGLGVNAVVKGCSAYIGFDDAIGFVTVDEEAAEGFEEFYTKVIYCLMDRKVAGESVEEMVAEGEKWIAYWSKPERYDPNIVAFLSHAINHLVIIGNRNERAWGTDAEIIVLSIMPDIVMNTLLTVAFLFFTQKMRAWVMRAVTSS